MCHRSDTGGRQIIGMDVVGKHIVSFIQGRHATLQTFDRQAIRRINARCAQNRDGDTSLFAPGTQGPLGIDPTRSTRTFRGKTASLIDLLPLTIAINACRTNVNQAPW